MFLKLFLLFLLLVGGVDDAGAKKAGGGVGKIKLCIKKDTKVVRAAGRCKAGETPSFALKSVSSIGTKVVS